MRPVVGRWVHYVSQGSPIRPDGSQLYPSTCRAAVVTEVLADQLSGDRETELGRDLVGLCVINPEGFHWRSLKMGGVVYDSEQSPGSWHWPERAES